MGGGDQERDALEEVMRQPDAILEPQILDTLRRYVMRGGKPQTVVELLSDNYVGYAQMASLMCSWLRSAEEEEEGGEEGGAVRQAAAAEESNEFSFLQKLVKERFDLDKFAGVFSTGGSKPPKWLDGLAADPQGRQLIYELSGQHKNCLLLNFAIQKILYQGHESEVANVGSSLSGYFGVFHRLMVTRLRSIAAASAAELPGEVSSLAKACCQDCHSYAHMQLVVSDLSCQSNGDRFHRLSQELESIAATEHGSLVWRMQPMFMRRKVSADHQRVAKLVGELLSEGAVAGPPSSAACSLGQQTAIHRLHQLYLGPDYPPTAPLRHPGLLKALTAALFAPDSNLQPEAHAMHAQLLALAVSAVDTPQGVDMSEVEEARQAIEQACSMAHDSLKGVKAGSSAIDMPAAAIGVLHFMELKLEDLDFYRSTACMAAAPVFLKLLNQIAIKHPSMRGQVVTIVSKSLHTMGNSKPTLARHFLDLAVLLLSYGEVAAVQQMADKWEKIADPSLVRHLVMQMLGVAAPPYSPEFAEWLLKLIKVGSFRKMRDAPRGSSEAYLLEEFATACNEGVEFPRPLTAKEKALLRELGP